VKKLVHKRKVIIGSKVDIDDLFSDVIRNDLADDEFWEWVKGWKDVDALCEEAEDWDEETKRKELKKLKKMYNI
jgi:hypothetical protein